METTVTTRKDQRREAILAVAAQVFAEEGFQAASMSTIAARLGGSKATLYNYFDSKEALFEAHIRSECGRIAAEVLDFADADPVPDVLQRLGERLLAQIYSGSSVRTLQIVIAEAGRTPELSAMFFRTGPQVGHDRLTRYLEEACARGEIATDNCHEAAWLFMAACRAHHLQVLLNVEPGPGPDEIRAQVRRAVQMFMASHGRN
jgi:AcrR family transcriptional regulator